MMMNEQTMQWVRAVMRAGAGWWMRALLVAGVTALLVVGCSREEETASQNPAFEPTVEKPAPAGVSYAPAPLAGYSGNPPQVTAPSAYPGATSYGQQQPAVPYGYAPQIDGTGYGTTATAPGYPPYDGHAVGAGVYPGQSAQPAAPPPHSGVVHPAPAVGAAGYAYPQVTQQPSAQSAYSTPPQQGGWGASDWQAGGGTYAPSTVRHPSGVAPAPLPQTGSGTWLQQGVPVQTDLYPSLDYDPSREARGTQAAPAPPAPAAQAAPAAPVAPAWGTTAVAPAAPTTAPVYPYAGYGLYGVAPGVYPPAYTTPIQPWAGLFPFFGGLPVW